MMRHLETLKRDDLEQGSAGSGRWAVSDTCHGQWEAATHAFLNRLEHCRQLFYFFKSCLKTGRGSNLSKVIFC